MVYNYNVDRGKYPDEKGYHQWTGFEDEKLIPGTTSSKYTPIHPLKFHEKFLDKGLLSISRGSTFTDFRIRCQIELETNNKYFQPKDWTIEKLLYNYDMLFHCVNNSQIVNDTLIAELHKHIKFLYEEYKINIKHRVNIKPFKRSFCND
jgi:hypothetical protein|tara:strand:+ start:917 stop:1363 length:447 start_codon:yes stop_codon:yes gene_type:complete